MKRSNMIELLHNYTSTLGIRNGDQTIDEEILRIIEEAGMTPPMWWDEKDPEYGKQTWEPEE